MPEVPPKTPTTRPDLRRVPVDVLTTLGWLNGTLHVPAHLALVDYLALGTHPLKLTGVTIPNEPERLKFLALRRETVVLVAPADPSEGELPGALAYTTELAVACLLPMGMLRGTLRVSYNLRLSDHLQQAGQLLTLRRCLLAPYGATAKSPGARGVDTAIVNLNHATGLSES